jgi:purine-binding chemotaxis protein CheW
VSGSSKDVLQGYFDELLTGFDAEEDTQGYQPPKTPQRRPNAAPPSSAAPTPQPQQEPATPIPPADNPPQISELNSAKNVAERLAKQKLARLLKSAPPEPAVEVKVQRPVVEKTLTHTEIDARTKARLLAETKIREKTVRKALKPNPTEVVVESLAPKPVVSKPAVSEAPLVPAPQVSDPAVPEPIGPEPSVSETIASEPAVAESTQQDSEDSLAWMPNGRPVWAQERFEVLLFSVSGLTLAVPLIALGQIQPLTEDLTPLFGQADWFMGLQPTPVGKIRTVNTAKFVMPERYDDAFLQSAKYVVSIDGLPWGLAVDSVNQPISLQPEDVKWRSERSKRPWLAGTVKEHMCALIDIPTMGKLLQQADANAPSAANNNNTH